MLNETDLSRTDLNLLVLFEAVLAEQHVGRAAERLHVSPSAVSHGLSRLRRLLHDPLFLRHPKGMVPTERAMLLAPAIADVLSRTRSIVTRAEVFDPATSTRRFLVAAPEAVSAVLLPPLLGQVRRMAPRVDLAFFNIGGQFEAVFAQLESREFDIALCPLPEVPLRFASRKLFAEEFVLVTRRNHPLGSRPTLARYCAAEHVLVSTSGALHGMVDELLQKRGLERRVVLAVSSFMLALAAVEQSDLVTALPRRFVEAHSKRFRVRIVRPPLPLPSDPICAIATRSALQDQGLAWLVDRIAHASVTATA